MLCAIILIYVLLFYLLNLSANLACALWVP